MHLVMNLLSMLISQLAVNHRELKLVGIRAQQNFKLPLMITIVLLQDRDRLRYYKTHQEQQHLLLLRRKE